MGERFSCESFSETESGRRGTRFEPWGPHEVSLRCFFAGKRLEKCVATMTRGGRGSAIIFEKSVNFSVFYIFNIKNKFFSHGREVFLRKFLSN